MEMPPVRQARRIPTITLLVALTFLTLASPAALAQVGPQLIVTVTFVDRVKQTGGAYYIAFNVDESILVGPQSDSTHWTHYVRFHGGRFFFGRVPLTPFRPFGFESIRPPEPYPFGQLLPDGRALRVRVALNRLQPGSTPIAQVKVNVVTVDDHLRPFDALGRGADDRFGFVRVDLRRDTYRPLTDPSGDARDPAFDISGGDIQVTTP